MKIGNTKARKFFNLLLFSLVLLVFCSQASGQDEEDGGSIIFTKPVKAVIFEHSIHTEQGLECDSCHDGMFEMEAGVAEQNDDFTMASLYEGNYCGGCHDGDTAFASNTRCTACHIGVKGYERLTGGTKDSGGGH